MLDGPIEVGELFSTVKYVSVSHLSGCLCVVGLYRTDWHRYVCRSESAG